MNTYSRTNRSWGAKAAGTMALLCVASCGGEFNGESAATDDVTATSEALEIVQCGSSLNMGLCNTYTTTSPDGTYISPRCVPSRYHVWDNTPPAQTNQVLRAVGRWADTLPSTQSTCELSIVEASIYGVKTDGTQTPTTKSQWRGAWNSNTKVCSFVAVDSSGSLLTASNLASIHVLGAAGTLVPPGVFAARKVTVGVSNTCPTPR